MLYFLVDKNQRFRKTDSTQTQLAKQVRRIFKDVRLSFTVRRSFLLNAASSALSPDILCVLPMSRTSNKGLMITGYS